MKLPAAKPSCIAPAQPAQPSCLPLEEPSAGQAYRTAAMQIILRVAQRSRVGSVSQQHTLPRPAGFLKRQCPATCQKCGFDFPWSVTRCFSAFSFFPPQIHLTDLHILSTLCVCVSARAASTISRPWVWWCIYDTRELSQRTCRALESCSRLMIRSALFSSFLSSFLLHPRSAFVSFRPCAVTQRAARAKPPVGGRREASKDLAYS
jgi:hypothetical protein